MVFHINLIHSEKSLKELELLLKLFKISNIKDNWNFNGWSIEETDIDQMPLFKIRIKCVYTSDGRWDIRRLQVRHKRIY